MSELSDATRDVRDARGRLVGYLQRAGLSTARANANLDVLVTAIQRLNAEVARDFAEQEDGLLDTPESAAYVKGIRDTADRIHPKETP